MEGRPPCRPLLLFKLCRYRHLKKLALSDLFVRLVRMSVAELKAHAKALSPKETGELYRYVRKLALRNDRVSRSRAKTALSPKDPLLNLATFAVAGPGGKLTNPEIDRILYGRP